MSIWRKEILNSLITSFKELKAILSPTKKCIHDKKMRLVKLSARLKGKTKKTKSEWENFNTSSDQSWRKIWNKK